MAQAISSNGGQGWRLADLARASGAALEGDGELPITHVDSLRSAGPGAITFLTHARYLPQLGHTQATAVIVPPELAARTALPRLVARDPYAAYAKIAALLHPPVPWQPGVHPTAIVDPSAELATGVSVGPFAVVGAGVVLGERVRVGAACVLGDGVCIGADSLLHPRVTIYPSCVVGPRAILHSGAVIGADGFGMAEEAGRWLKIPQIGRVVIGADVEIGANTTIDRGALDDTVIEDDVKLDNQIQIGHNCRIGTHTAIAGCVGIAGSARIGKNCKIAGAAKISGHLTIPDYTVVGPATVILSSIDKPGLYTGVFPVMEHTAWKRIAVELRRLGGLARRLRALEQGSPTERMATGIASPAQEEER